MHDAEEYHKIVVSRASRKPETVYEYMEKWIQENGTDELTPVEYRRFVSHLNPFTKRLVKYRLTEASKSPYRYWF